MPADCVVLTLACGKFRFFDKELGAIGGIPRLLDMGQCNDAYSAIQVAVALSKAFGVGVNDLPLSMILSWYEQKAVVILLTLSVPGDQEYPSGAVASGLYHAERTGRPRREVRDQADYDPGCRSEVHPRLIGDVREGSDRDGIPVIFLHRAMRRTIPVDVELQNGGGLLPPPFTKGLNSISL